MSNMGMNQCGESPLLESLLTELAVIVTAPIACLGNIGKVGVGEFARCP